MSTQVRNAAGAYRRNAVMTASREKLVVLLYEGALRFMDQAVLQFKQGDGAAGQTLSRAFAIVSELRTALDHEKGGKIATDLDKLYVFVQDRLLEATRTRSPERVAEARQVMAQLKEAWDGILDHSV
jgi:flagellar protein FliS